jgi:hypothetical protein
MTIREHLDQAQYDLFQARERAILYHLDEDVIQTLGTLYRAVTRMKMKIEEIHNDITWQKEKEEIRKAKSGVEVSRASKPN